MGIVKHSVQRTFSVLSVLAIMGIIGWAVYSGYVILWKPFHNPTPTTNQRAERIVNTQNYYMEDVEKLFLGIKNIPLFFGHKIDIGIGIGKKKQVKDVPEMVNGK
jgi:hypothetical protein